MTQNFVSSVPAIYEALYGLIEKAAAEQSPIVFVTPFELGQYEPGSYVIVGDIVGPRYEWEAIGTFSQREIYEVGGKVSIFTGAAPADNKEVAVNALNEAFRVLQNCVMTPVFSHRNMPILGTAGPSPFLMLPNESELVVGTTNIGGWAVTITWSFRFEAVITPA